jgi:pimeloyl-ACP methyl ester carboxylesterase
LGLSIDTLGHVRRAGQLGYQAAAQIKAPVLILQGTEDIVALPQFTRQLAQQLPQLNGYLEVEGDHELSRATTKAWPLIAALVQQFVRNTTLTGEVNPTA